jgi:aspartate-semialdehyde dehydrogenase
LENQPRLAVYPNPAEYPLQIEVTGAEQIHVGRIRKDNSVAHGFNLWIVADNIHLVAQSTVEIAKRVIEKFA